MMPIEAPLLPRLDEDVFRKLDYLVMGYAFASQRELGRLCDESVYQADLASRLAVGGIPVSREVPVTVRHRDFSKGYVLDWLIGGAFVYEAKTVAALTPRHHAQLLNYLFLTQTSRGKIINFRMPSVESAFVNATVDEASRRSMRLVLDALDPSGHRLRDALLELIADWGLFLETALYNEALVHFAGGEVAIVRQLPMRRGSVFLGNQRFQLTASESDSAFVVTSIRGEHATHERHLRNLLEPSPLRALHWFNLHQREARFQTLAR